MRHEKDVRAVPYPPDAAVLVEDAVLHVEPAGLGHVGIDAPDALAILRMHGG